jgi:hypothetical protein
MPELPEEITPESIAAKYGIGKPAPAAGTAPPAPALPPTPTAEDIARKYGIPLPGEPKPPGGTGRIYGQVIDGKTGQVLADHGPPPKDPDKPKVEEAKTAGPIDFTRHLSDNRNLDFVDRLLRPEKYPVLKNDDGSISTHLMASSGNIAYPTLVRKPGEDNLTKMSPGDAYRHAINTGEHIKFDTPEEAAQFAEGGYKPAAAELRKTTSASLAAEHPLAPPPGAPAPGRWTQHTWTEPGERSFLGEIGASFMRGLGSLIDMPRGIMAAFGIKTEPGLGERWQKDFAPSPSLSGSISQKPSLLLNPRWWASALPSFAVQIFPIVAASLGGEALAAGLLGAEAAATVTGMTTVARAGLIGGEIAGGLIGVSDAGNRMMTWEKAHPGEEIPALEKIMIGIGAGAAGAYLPGKTLAVLGGKEGEKILASQAIKKIFGDEGVGKTIAERAVRATYAGGAMAGFSIIENAFEKYGYNPDREVTQGVLESLVLGSILGGIHSEYGLARTRAAKENREAQYLDDFFKEVQIAYNESKATLEKKPYHSAAKGALLEGLEKGERVEIRGRTATIEGRKGKYITVRFEDDGSKLTVNPTVIKQVLRAVKDSATVGPSDDDEKVVVGPHGKPVVDELNRPILMRLLPAEIQTAMSKQPWQRNPYEVYLAGLMERPEMRAFMGPRPEEPGKTTTEIPGTYRRPEKPEEEPYRIIDWRGIDPKDRPESAVPYLIGSKAETRGEEIITAMDYRQRAQLGEQVVERLRRGVDIIGDPNMSKKLSDLLDANQELIGNVFRVPVDIPGAPEVMNRITQLAYLLEDSGGDPKVARELTDYINSNLRALRGFPRWPVGGLEVLRRLTDYVQEAGDPETAEKLNNELSPYSTILNTLDGLTTAQRQDRINLGDLAGRALGLMERIEDSGDPVAAKELTSLIASNPEAFKNISAAELERTKGSMAKPAITPAPMVSGPETKEVTAGKVKEPGPATTPAVAGPDAKAVTEEKDPLAAAKEFRKKFGTRQIPTGLVTEGMAPDLDPVATGFAPATPEPGSLPTYKAFPVTKLEIAPEVFQHKRAAQADTGITGTLEEVTWQEERAGMLGVFETKDGRFIVAHGHNRVWRANRDEVATVPIKFYREVDGWTPERVKASAFFDNLADDKLDALDIAQFLRETSATVDDLRAAQVSMKKGEVQTGLGLSGLIPRIWEDVYTGKYPEKEGAIIGEGLRDNPAAQQALYQRILERKGAGKETPPNDLRYLVESGRVALVEEGEQANLFGKDQVKESRIFERANLVSTKFQELREAKRVFSFAQAEKERLEEAGNIIKGRNEELAAAANAARAVFDKAWKQRGTASSEVLDEYSERLAKAKNRGEENAIRKEASKALDSAIERDYATYFGPVPGRPAGAPPGEEAARPGAVPGAPPEPGEAPTRLARPEIKAPEGIKPGARVEIGGKAGTVVGPEWDSARMAVGLRDLVRVQFDDGTFIGIDPRFIEGERYSADEAFGLKPTARKVTKLEQRINQLAYDYPTIDQERASIVLRTFPDATDEQVANMVADPEMYDRMVKGTLTQADKDAMKPAPATQPTLPGMNIPGRLFKAQLPLPYEEVRDVISPKDKVPPPAVGRRADLPLLADSEEGKWFTRVYQLYEQKRLPAGRDNPWANLGYSEELAGRPIMKEVHDALSPYGIRIVPVKDSPAFATMTNSQLGPYMMIDARMDDVAIRSAVRHEIFHHRVAENDIYALNLLTGLNTSTAKFQRLVDEYQKLYREAGLRPCPPEEVAEELVAHFVESKGLAKVNWPEKTESIYDYFMNPDEARRNLDAYLKSPGMIQLRSPGEIEKMAAAERPERFDVEDKNLWQGLQAALFPTTLSKEHQAMAPVFRGPLGEWQRRVEEAITKQGGDRLYWDKQGVHDPRVPLRQNPGLKFISDYMTGKELSDDLKPMAQRCEEEFSRRADLLAQAGIPLNSVREQYFGLAYTKESIRAFNQALKETIAQGVGGGKEDLNTWTPEEKKVVYDRVQELMAAGQGSDASMLSYFSRRPLGGRQTFRKEKVFEDVMSAVDFGLRPVSNNPVDLAFMKYAEMDKAICDAQIEQTLKAQGDEQFLRIGKKLPEGWKYIEGREVFAPPEKMLKEYVDQNIYDSLSEVAKNLGVRHERRFTASRGALGFARGRMGYAGGEEVVTQFATELGVLGHEIGHVLDFRYNLWDRLVTRAKGWEGTKRSDLRERVAVKEELRNLADLKLEGQENVSNFFRSYIRKKPEQIAHILEAYTQCPERLQEVAPKIYLAFQRFVNEIPELAPLRELRGGIAFKELQTKMNIGGFPKVGQWIARDPAADILNNYLSKDLYTNPYVGKAYRDVMALSNTLNQAQLGALSLFHGGVSELNVQLMAGSDVMKDIYRLATGQGSVKDLATSLAKFPVAMVRVPMVGKKVLQEFRNPSLEVPLDRPVGELPNSPEARLAQVAKATELAGGGYQMDPHLRTWQTERLIKEWYGGEKWKAALRSPLAFLEWSMKPVMEWLVPRVKAGTYAEKVGRILEQNPGKTMKQLAGEFGTAWNEIDAILGQVRYQRYFINNTAKNIGQMLIRAPGWSGGTIAWLGGAPLDAVKFFREWVRTGKAPSNIPDRVAYTVALLGGMAIVNGLMTLAATGDQPQGRDFWAFRDGGIDQYGNPTRWVLPTYAKDIFGYWQNPGHVILAKLHPGLSLVAETIRGTDYYGHQIRDPERSYPMQALETGIHAVKAFEPFWIKGTVQSIEQADRNIRPERLLGPLVGVMPAPRAYTMTDAQKVIDRYHQLHRGIITRETAAESKLKSDLMKLAQAQDEEGFREMASEAVREGSLTRAQVHEIVDESQMPVSARRFYRLPLDWAIKAWNEATGQEKDQWEPWMLKKLMSSKPEILLHNRGGVVKLLQSLGMDDVADRIDELTIPESQLMPSLAGLGVERELVMGEMPAVEEAFTESLAKKLAEKPVKIPSVSPRRKESPYHVLGM